MEQMNKNLNSYTSIDLPGLKKISFKSKFLQDFIFFLAVVALPSSFFALIPPAIFFDLKVDFLLVGLVYIAFNFKYIKKVSKLPAGKILILLNVYLVFQVAYSLFVQEIPFTEVAAIFRANFFYPITALGFLLYVASMNNRRIYRFMYWLLLATFIQGSLYIFSNLTGINVFATGLREYSFKGTEILQNMFAIPHYNEVLFTFAFLAALSMKGFNRHWLWFVPLVVTIISIVRSQMIVYLLVVLLIFILAKVSKVKVNVSKLFNISLLSGIFLIIVLLLFPAHIGRVIHKFGFDKQEELTRTQYLEQGTYKLRLNLIEDAYTRTKSHDNLLLGMGYIREAKKGEYDFVVGGDTLIAPVLYTEGLLGLTIRILPIFILLFYFIRILKSTKNRRYRLFAIIAISLILPEIPNVVQTRYFVYYNREMFILFILAIIIYNDKKRRNKLEKVSIA